MKSILLFLIGGVLEELEQLFQVVGVAVLDGFLDNIAGELVQGELNEVVLDCYKYHILLLERAILDDVLHYVVSIRTAAEGHYHGHELFQQLLRFLVFVVLQVLLDNSASISVKG